MKKLRTFISAIAIKPGECFTVTARSQDAEFRPEQIIIEHGGEDWAINDIKIGNRSQFSQSGEIPGEIFGPGNDSFVSFDTVQAAMDFSLLVTYKGNAPEGKVFECTVFGSEPS